jgi:hypothetical protein
MSAAFPETPIKKLPDYTASYPKHPPHYMISEVPTQVTMNTLFRGVTTCSLVEEIRPPSTVTGCLFAENSAVGAITFLRNNNRNTRLHGNTCEMIVLILILQSFPLCSLTRTHSLINTRHKLNSKSTEYEFLITRQNCRELYVLKCHSSSVHDMFKNKNMVTNSLVATKACRNTKSRNWL